MTTITLGGKEFTVRYPLNSIRALERETGKSVFQIVDLTSFSIDLMICVIWAGVLHANRLLTVAAVWAKKCPDIEELTGVWSSGKIMTKLEHYRATVSRIKVRKKRGQM